MDGLREALRFIRTHDSFILTTHEGPDADGIGAEILLLNALRRFGKSARVVNSDAIPPRYSFLDPENVVERWSPPDHRRLASGTAVVILDSDAGNLGPIKDTLVANAAEILVIDHHEQPAGSAVGGYVDTSASSTSELALEISLALGSEIDPVSARAALTGIVYDTGSFMYPKTHERTFLAAARLVAAGAVTNEIFRALFESASVGSLLLQKRVLATMDFREGNRIAIQTMRGSDLREAGARYEDAEHFINTPLHCKEVEVSVFFKESEEGRLRCSLRSKGAVDVSLIARGFGGGGHRTAAGFKCGKGLAETREEVLQEVSAALAAAASGGR